MSCLAPWSARSEISFFITAPPFHPFCQMHGRNASLLFLFWIHKAVSPIGEVTSLGQSPVVLPAIEAPPVSSVVCRHFAMLGAQAFLVPLCEGPLGNTPKPTGNPPFHFFSVPAIVCSSLSCLPLAPCARST